MSIKLNFSDFKLDRIEQITGGAGPNTLRTDCNCTDGDVGCCDEMRIDDTVFSSASF